MERILTTEEKIRRAEEIYNRRKQGEKNVRVEVEKVNAKSKPQLILFKKMIIQIIICSLIYFIFYLIQNTNYIFSESVLNKTKEILSYDINFQGIYNQTMQKVNGLKSSTSIEGAVTNTIEENTNEEVPEENLVNEQNMNETNVEETETNIGGMVENNVLNEEVSYNQEELDIMDIKNKVNLVSPLKGQITSRYGIRNPTTESVPKNHTGIDIAANTGTQIIAAMPGIVTTALNQGDYGIHLKIEYEDIMTVYAHCSKLHVKVGDTVTIGQKIAEVGSTGNSTGPHLHFEIRKSGRNINPENLISF